MVRRPAVDELQALAALYAAKAAAEQEAADALLPRAGVRSVGPADARVLLVKGEPGAHDRAAGEAVAGPDREAALAALVALDVPVDTVRRVCSRPAPRTPPGAAAERLAVYLVSSDPALAVALDAVAAHDLAVAAGLRTLPFGEPVVVDARTLLAVDGLEASLDDSARKRRVWLQFKSLGP